MKELEKTYSPEKIEGRIYKKWLEEKYFHAKVNKDKKPFTIIQTIRSTHTPPAVIIIGIQLSPIPLRDPEKISIIMYAGKATTIKFSISVPIFNTFSSLVNRV